MEARTSSEELMEARKRIANLSPEKQAELGRIIQGETKDAEAIAKKLKSAAYEKVFAEVVADEGNALRRRCLGTIMAEEEHLSEVKFDSCLKLACTQAGIEVPSNRTVAAIFLAYHMCKEMYARLIAETNASLVEYVKGLVDKFLADNGVA